MTYRVEIVKKETREVVSVVGERLSEARAERRELTGLSRVNDDCFVRTTND